jgi:hypothetical protein
VGKWRVCFEDGRVQIDKPWEPTFTEASGKTPAEALLDAAYRLLKTDEVTHG